MKNVYLFQPNYKGGMGQFTSHWLPYSIATIWAYVEQFDFVKNNFKVQKTFFNRGSEDEVMSNIIDPDICMFSTYIWNENYNLLMAEKIKSKYPNCVIVFGGPQIHTDGFSFQLTNPFVDCVVLNEGEESTKKILESVLNGEKLQKSYRSNRLVSLEDMPSCYTDTDIMENLISENNSKWSATLETNRGCPFKCTFCDWGSLTHSKVKKFNLEKVFADIDWMADHGVEQIIIADANFGMFYERDKAIAQYIIDANKRTGFPKNVNMTHYKNSTEKVVEIVSMLASAGLNRGMSLSVQSLNDQVLEGIERKNMEINQLSVLYDLCNKNNISYYTEFIMCLPYETKETWIDGIVQSIEAGCHGYLELYPLELLRNSAMNQQVETHGFEVFNYDVVEKNQPSKIPEKHNYVISSKYMPREDYIEAWMNGWVIVNFHTFGWTQIIARVARKHLNLTYKEIYQNLYEFILTNDLFKELYDEYKTGFVNFLYNDPNNPDVFARANDVTPDAIQFKFHEQRSSVVREIQKWATILFKDVPKELVDEILVMQDTFIVKFEDTENKQTRKFKYNLLEFINDKNTTLVKIESKYCFTNVMQWDDREDFYAKIYMKIRDGFTKKRITNIMTGKIQKVEYANAG